jgi:hypothetical protein
MKRIAGFLAVASLVLAPAVEAKGTATLRVCGEDACVTLADRAAYVLSPQETVFEPPPVARYYRLDVTLVAGREPQRHSLVFVPSSGLLAANAGADRALSWYVPPTEALNQLRPAIAELEAFEAPTAWPLAVEEAAAASARASVADGRDWTPYIVAAGLIVLTLAAFVLAARRLRVRRPKTA